MQDNLPRSIVHFRYISWSFDEFLGCFHTSPLERTGERASSPGPALPHQDVKVLAGIRAQLFCVKPQMRHLKISTHFPDLGGPYFFQTWDFNWCFFGELPPFRANRSKNRGYLNVHVWIHAAGGECRGCFNNPRRVDLGRVFDVSRF